MRNLLWQTDAWKEYESLVHRNKASNKASKINLLLTLEYMKTESENKYFDRKSAQIRMAELAQYISAFANADGGTLVIGISDKKRTLEGINSCGDEKINEFINAPKDCCISEALNEAETMIVEAIRKFPGASQVALAAETGFSRSKVQRIMKKLAEDKVIYHDGAKKNGFWRVFGG